MPRNIVNPELEYYVVSLKHTDKRDKYFTLWRPENAGYCYPLSIAGVYKGYEDGYHKSEGNVPVIISDLPVRFIVLDDRLRQCIGVSKEAIKFIQNYKP